MELLLANFPHNKEASAGLERARGRSLEEKSGDYNFRQLQKKAKKLSPPQLDHATYIGPVEVKQTKAKGRGLFITKAVKAGDLLFCEKAFASAYTNEDTKGGSKMTMLMNPETNRGFFGAQADLIKLIVQKLHCNPSLAPAFTTLYHGDYDRVSTTAVDGEPVVDT
jgi:hypothetical protein